MKNSNLSLLDKDQVTMRMFDEQHDAQRVIMVGSDGKEIVAGIKEALKDIQINVKTEPQQTIQPSIQYEKVEIPIIIKEIEYREIEKPVFFQTQKIEYVERYITVPEYKFIENHRDIIVKEYKDIPKIFIWLFSIQLLINLIALILHR